MDLFNYEDERMRKKQRSSRSIVSRLFSGLVKLALAAGVIYLSYTYLVISRVPTESMADTIIPGDYVLAVRTSYTDESTPRSGDIVLFTKNKTFLCKRIVAMAGDTVSFEDGDLYINGEKANERYIKDPDVETNSPKTFEVPENSCFVLGDNREHSTDSRYWEDPYISYDKLQAKVLFVLPIHIIKPM